MRTTARETVYKYLFSRLFNGNDEGLFTALKIGARLNEKDGAFADELLSAVLKDVDFFNEKISEFSHSFAFDRIFATDKCAIYIGMAELKSFPDTPKAVAINEAVNIAAKYSTDKSTDFVNGILARFAEEIDDG